MTVAEALKQSGLSDAEISALDAKVLTGLTTVVNSATEERNRAELAQRAAEEMFEKQINPALNQWGNRETNLTAELNYYKTLAEKAKDGGFIAEVPPFSGTPRAADGKFVANTNTVPGSPDITAIQKDLWGGIGTITDVQWEYRKLFGEELPEAPTRLAAEATAQKLPFADYVARKFDFAGRKAKIEAEAKAKETEAIRKAAVEERDKYWAERTGTNPNVRMAETSRFADLTKGVKDGTRVDPLKMTREQRHQATAQAIRSEMAAAATIQ